MSQVELRCKDDNTKLITKQTDNGYYIYTCPYCGNKKSNIWPMIIKI